MDTLTSAELLFFLHQCKWIGGLDAFYTNAMDSIIGFVLWSYSFKGHNKEQVSLGEEILLIFPTFAARFLF